MINGNHGYTHHNDNYEAALEQGEDRRPTGIFPSREREEARCLRLLQQTAPPSDDSSHATGVHPTDHRDDRRVSLQALGRRKQTTRTRQRMTLEYNPLNDRARPRKTPDFTDV